MSIYFIFIKNASYKWLFITITFLLIGSQFGKYSAIEISRQNQIDRLQDILKNHKNLETLSISEQYNIYSTINYLYKYHGEDTLKEIFPKIIDRYENNISNRSDYLPNFISKEINLDKNYFFINRYIHKYVNRKEIKIDNFKYMKILNILDVDTFIKLNNQIKLLFKSNNIEIYKNKKLLDRVDLTNFFESIIYKKRVFPKDMEYFYKGKNIKFKLIFNSISLSNRLELKYIDGYILY